MPLAREKNQGEKLNCPPFVKGEQIVPLAKGDSREAAGGRSHKHSEETELCTQRLNYKRG